MLGDGSSVLMYSSHGKVCLFIAQLHYNSRLFVSIYVNDIFIEYEVTVIIYVQIIIEIFIVTYFFPGEIHLHLLAFYCPHCVQKLFSLEIFYCKLNYFIADTNTIGCKISRLLQ